MDVYLVPVGPDRLEPYCEADDSEETIGAPASSGTRLSWWRRQVDKFRAAVAEAEAERRRRDLGEETPRRGVGAWVMGRIAEAVAEQRLLWRLRHATVVTLHHPDAMPADRAVSIMRKSLSSDYRKHRNWCGIDALLALILGPGLFFIPGPNVVGWYFAFRAIGHFFALKGARQGLDRVDWRPQPSSHLMDIQHLFEWQPAERMARLDAIAAALDLKHLPAFVNRMIRGGKYHQAAPSS